VSMPTGAPFKTDDIVYRPDHVFSGDIATMRVIESRPHFTDCEYIEAAGFHVSHPTHTLRLYSGGE
jgi:hypothetical protein